MTTGRRTTSADVALRAGVSRATVSYVLNGSTRHSIPDATRARILAAAADLGYTPHAAARALRRGRSGLVLVVLSDVPLGTNLATLLAGLTHGVAGLGLSAVTWTRGVGQPLRDVLAHLVPQVAVALARLPEADREAFAAAGVPVVPLLADAGDGPQHGVGDRQVRLLAAAGHRRLAVVAAGDPALAEFAVGRRDGALAAARDLGLPAPHVLEVAAPVAAAAPAVTAALRTWTAGPEPVTGVCCYNDVHAALTLHAARTAGLAIPADLSVVGVDDEPLAAFTDPPLTTVRFDLDRAVAVAVRRCRALVGDPAEDGGTDGGTVGTDGTDGRTDDEGPVGLGGHVVHRASVGPPPPPAARGGRGGHGGHGGRAAGTR